MNVDNQGARVQCRTPFAYASDWIDPVQPRIRGISESAEFLTLEVVL